MKKIMLLGLLLCVMFNFSAVECRAETEVVFEDIETGDWFYEAVCFNYENKLMTGMDETHFGPYGSLSRAQFSLILYRMSDTPAVSGTSPFKDVTGDEWYGSAVLWAYENKIVTGYQNGNFGPADLITREQMALMMYRYASYLELDVSESAEYEGFTDGDKVSGFAENAMKWAIGEGIITGKEQGTKIDPQGNTARSECAVIIMRFIKNYEEPESPEDPEIPDEPADPMEVLKDTVNGKNFSILADSISTYEGYSNDAKNTNSTIGKNAVWYSGNSMISGVNHTWWMQAVKETGMNLLVNNAWSGSQVLDLNWRERASSGDRAINLHDNTGDNAGTKPDVIAIFMGINDFDFDIPLGDFDEDSFDAVFTDDGGYIVPMDFTEAYIVMLTKIIDKYPDADVFCFTLLPNSVKTDYEALRVYNKRIEDIASFYDFPIVDLYYDSGINETNFKMYTSDGLHPNNTGMDMITDTFVNAMIDYYVK